MKCPDDDRTAELPGVSGNVPLYTVFASELEMLNGAGVHAMALYLAVLKPRAVDGLVQGLTYKKIAGLLTTVPSRRGGRRPEEVTVPKVCGWLERLELAGLVLRDVDGAKETRELRIFITAPR